MNRSKTLRSAGDEPRSDAAEAGAVDRPARDDSPETEAEDSGEREGRSTGHLTEEQAVLFITLRLSDERRQNVERHLDHCEPCRQLVQSVIEWGDSTRDRKVGTAWRGSVIPRGLQLAHRYRVQRFVARGGMGEVYDVMDEALGERIALKTVASQFSDDDEAISQLKAEVQIARRVSHKNVCRIFDIGTHETEDGPPLVFLTMEYIDGQSLGDRIRQDPPLTVRECRRLATGILEGLNAVHDSGVLHRDLKSDNVMLRVDRGGKLSAVLMDFGLASALNPNSSRVSGDRALVGSLAYMAPEQVQGEALRVTTDVYAFGVVLFEMLTRRLPFVASTPALAALKRLQHDAPRLRSIDSSLPIDLDDIVARCLERDPKRRYASARDVLADLAPSVRLKRFKRPTNDADEIAQTVAAPLHPAAAAPVEATSLTDPPRSEHDGPPGPSATAPSTDSSLLPSTTDPRSQRRSIAAAAVALLIGVSLGAFFFGRDSQRGDTESESPRNAAPAVGERPPPSASPASPASPAEKPNEPTAEQPSVALEELDPTDTGAATTDSPLPPAQSTTPAHQAHEPTRPNVSRAATRTAREERDRSVPTPSASIAPGTTTPTDTTVSSASPSGSVLPTAPDPDPTRSRRADCPPGLMCPDKLSPPRPR